MKQHGRMPLMGEPGVLYPPATIFLITIFLLSFFWVPAGSAQDNPPFVWEVQVLESDRTGLSDPVGLAFSARANAFQVLEGRGAPGAAELVGVSPFADRLGVAQIGAAVQDPINLAYDNVFDRLFLVPGASGQLLVVQAGADGALDMRTLARLDARSWGVGQPQGLTVDGEGNLFILDAVGPRVIRVEPGPGGDLASATVSEFGLDLASPRGIAFDASTGRLHVLTPADQMLYELDPGGGVLAVRDLAQFELRNPQGMVFAPSGDQTDDPAQLSLFVADSATVQNSGQIVELSLVVPASLPAGTSMLPASVVGGFDTSIWNHPSPDPGGIVYFPAIGRFLITDSEIEESVSGQPPAYWHGYNVFISSLSGSLVGNCTTYTSGSLSLAYNNFSHEPTGVSVNPNNNHIFFTNDGSNGRLFEVKPGGDGQYCTPDDIVVRRYVAKLYGATDAEDVTYGNNTLFIADGINAEVWVIPLGPDGVMSDDDGPVTHWDTAALGFNDLEGIAYNPEGNTLFIVSTKGSENYLGEFSLTGQLLRAYDLSFMGTQKNIRSAVAYAPASQNASARSIYIASRGKDNNSDRLENDGKVWEISISGGTVPTSTPTPTAAPGPTPTPTSPPSGSDLIFADGFESGNLSAWTSSVVDGGDLSVTAGAALVGNRGLQAVIDDNVAIYVTDDTPNAEARYRARFYFHPNSISMISGDSHYLIIGYSGTSTAVVRGAFRYSSGNYQIRFALLNDSGTWLNTGWQTITNAPHSLEMDWRAATGPGKNDGSLTLWIDGAQKGSLTAVDNDTRRIDRVRLGAANAIDSGTRGTYYFDAFESRRQTYIGP